MDILYKYVTAKRVFTCIPEVGDGTLRATQPASLNDPFECTVVTPYVFKSKAEENRQLAETLTKINKRKPISADDVFRARQEHGSLFTRQLFAEQVSTRFGIISFTENPYHPLMWSHYTIDASGFVIGYDVTELRKLIGQNGCFSKLKYGEQPPPIFDPVVLVFPESNLSKLLSIKSKHWSYEDEWRLIVELEETIGTGIDDPRGQPINLVRIPNEAVVSVYYTERTPRESVELISERLADKNNRYRAIYPRKLVLSSESYGYEEAPTDSDS